MTGSFADQGRSLLDQAWCVTLEMEGTYAFDPDLAIACDRVFAGGEAGYHKAIVIQAAGKAANPLLDAQAMQKGTGIAGSWDAREFAKRVFVPWNTAAGSPFAHAADPYVSNPYRILRFDASVREQRQRKVEFDNALVVLERLNATDDADGAMRNLVEVVFALRRFIADRSVDYPLPNRASLAATLACVEAFVAQRSGGARLQAVVLAMFKTLAACGMDYADIRSRHVNASDAGSGVAGDVTYTIGGAASAVEVKDRALSRVEFGATVEKCRVSHVTEVMIVIRASALLEPDFGADAFAQECARQFSSGLNIYLAGFADIATAALTLVGEAGRRRMLEEVGNALTEQNANITHKWAWAELVKAI